MSSKIICSICLEDLNGSESEAIALGCGHVFDRTCIDQCFNVTKTCPICKKRGFQYETRRLYFSSDSRPPERDDRLTRQLKQTIELHRMEIGVARAKCYELQDLLTLVDNKRKKAEIFHQQALKKIILEEEENVVLNRTIASLKEEVKALKEKHAQKDKEREAEFAAAEENINKVHATITKGLHKEIQNYENQLLIANEEVKKLSAAPENKKKLDSSAENKKKLDTENKKRLDTAGIKKKLAQEETMEQRVKKLEKQVQELQIATKKKHSEGTSSRKRPSKSRGSPKALGEGTNPGLEKLAQAFKKQ